MIGLRSGLGSAALHAAMLFGIAAAVGDTQTIQDLEETDRFACSFSRPTWKVGRIDRISDGPGRLPRATPPDAAIPLADLESPLVGPDGVIFHLYFPAGQAICHECVRMMQEAHRSEGRIVSQAQVVDGLEVGVFVGWKSPDFEESACPRHPGGCRAFHLLGIDVFCTCCSVADQRLKALGENPR